MTNIVKPPKATTSEEVLAYVQMAKKATASDVIKHLGHVKPSTVYSTLTYMKQTKLLSVTKANGVFSYTIPAPAVVALTSNTTSPSTLTSVLAKNKTAQATKQAVVQTIKSAKTPKEAAERILSEYTVMGISNIIIELRRGIAQQFGFDI